MIQKRPKADGSISYRAIIRIHKGKRVVHSESSTFAKKKDAELWEARRRLELVENGIPSEQKTNDDVSVRRLIEMYEEVMEEVKPYGRSKDYCLRKWKKRPQTETLVKNVDSKWIIDFARMRRTEENAGASTINHDIVHLRGIFAVARDMLGVDVDPSPFDKARATLTKMGLTSKAGERDRRPRIDEITAIVKYAHNRKKSAYHRKEHAPMDKLIVFQMFSGRRISETCRLLWGDLDREKQMVLVRDMKDPRKKKGNNVWCYIPDEAWAIIESMEEGEPTEQIFPYESKSVSTNFQRIRAKAGFNHVEDEDNNLRIHDLRHECLSWLAEKNGLQGEHWDIPRIQLVSGHANWNVLQRYVNLLTESPLDKWKDWEWKTKVLD